MKKIVSLTLLLIMLIVGTTTATAQESDGEQLANISDGRVSRTIEDLFDEYNPSEKQTYLDIKSEHAEFHENRKGIRLEAVQNYAAKMSEISGQVADGTLTPAEGKEQLKVLRSEIKSFIEEAKAIIEQKKAEAQGIKDEIVTLKDSIRDELKKDEVVASKVAAYLEELNTLLQEHLDMDYHYAELIDEISPS